MPSTVVEGKTAVTAEDLWRLCHEDDSDAELIKGEVRELVPPGQEHGKITTRICIRVGGYAERERLGDVFSECGYIIARNPDTVLAPDLSFTSKARLPAETPSKFSEILPDLAIEVVSPSDTYTEVREKADIYLQAGVQEVWIVDPRRQALIVRRVDGSSRTFQGEQCLKTPLLPGLEMVVKDIFE